MERPNESITAFRDQSELCAHPEVTDSKAIAILQWLDHLEEDNKSLIEKNVALASHIEHLEKQDSGAGVVCTFAQLTGDSEPTHEQQEVTHRCPPKGSGLMPCCNKTPFDVLADRMTLDDALVTCNRSDDTPTTEQQEFRIGDEVKYHEQVVHATGMVVDWEYLSERVTVYNPIDCQLVTLPAKDFTVIGRYEESSPEDHRVFTPKAQKS